MLLPALALAILPAPAPPPPLAHRWVYVQTNFYRPELVERTLQIVDRAAKAGYNGIAFTDTKLQALSPYPEFYVKAVGRLLQAAEARHMEVIPLVLPTGYAGPMLARDPSLVESMPCRDVPFVAHSGVLTVEQDPAVAFVNGGFERASGDALPGMGFQDGAGKTSFVDREVRHGGANSLRMENPGALTETGGNCRVMKRIPLKPWHQYRFSVWVKTEGFDQASSVRAMVLDSKGKALSFGDADVRPTQEWRKSSVVFNSRGESEGLFYLGVWGGNKGKLWFDDVSLEDAGLLNVTRRPGCPLTMKSEEGAPLAEGKDTEAVADPSFGNVPWKGEFDFAHEAPSVKLAAGSRIKEGQRVRMSYYAATATDSGKTAICPSEPATRALMRDELARVDALFHPSGFFFSHDEIRVMDWCGACAARKVTPGQLLADDIRASTAMAQAVRPGAKMYVWSDMFDPFHNAVDEYYACNGSVKESWLGLPKNAVIVNWNSARPKESLDFFAKRGHRQILAGYYDSSVEGIKPWMAQAQATGSLDGVMYTTWADRYDDLEAFARVAWGGPAG